MSNITFVLPALTEIDINNNKILAELAAIDAKTIRALRENDIQRITDLEDQAISLRLQLLLVS